MVVAGDPDPALAFGLVVFALVFSVLNAAVLFIRIRTEQVALANGDLAVTASR